MQIFLFDTVFTTQCLDAALASGGVTVVVAEDSRRDQMNHARPIRTPRQHRASCRRVAAVVALESARKRSNAKRFHARQTSEVAVDVAAAGVVARNPVRSVYCRRESAVRQLILRVEDRPARRVVLRSHLAEAVAAEPSNVQGAKSSLL